MASLSFEEWVAIKETQIVKSRNYIHIFAFTLLKPELYTKVIKSSVPVFRFLELQLVTFSELDLRFPEYSILSGAYLYVMM